MCSHLLKCVIAASPMDIRAWKSSVQKFFSTFGHYPEHPYKARITNLGHIQAMNEISQSHTLDIYIK
jgi:hypothetical protein